MANETPLPSTPPVKTPSPSTAPMKPSGSSLVWHIVLIVLLVAGFALLFFKINSDTSVIKTDVASIKTESAALSGKVGAMEEKVGKIESEAAQKATEKVNATEKITLYKDDTYRVKFTTSNACKDYYLVKSEEIDKANNSGETKNYAVYVPGSKSWGENYWRVYSIFTQESYDKLKADELPGKPSVLLNLDSETLLTTWGMQDMPNDVCGLAIGKGVANEDYSSGALGVGVEKF